jgi:hypothetical protein
MTKAVQILEQSAQWAWKQKLRLAALILAFVLAAPQPVRSQFLDPCCTLMAAGLTSITSALTTVVGGGLNSILTVEQGISNFEQVVVWPQNLINQARLLVQSIRGTFNQIRAITRIPVNSATLPGPQQLEVNLLSGDSNQIGQTSAQYTAVYGAVPDATVASPQTRNMIDMSDAAAQAAMKRAIEIDSLADLELQAADQINQSIQVAAPGSAPIIEAQADAWLVRANAYTQAATADLLRVRAIDLANQSANVKNGAANSAAIQQQILNLLQRH